MNDTSPEIAEIVRTRLLARTGAELLVNRKPCQRFRLVHDLFHAHQVELPVDKAGAFPVELVGQPVRAQHGHIEVLGIGLDGAANSLPELEAALR